MRRRKHREVREANRVSNCAHCNRPFAVCGRCDRGRLHCSPECARTRRQGQVRRAGRRYQPSDRGRTAHALRQARYRARRASVTHPSVARTPNLAAHAPGPISASGSGPERAEAGVTSERPSWVGAPPACARCGQSSGFLRNGFRVRPTVASHARCRRTIRHRPCAYARKTS
jgi:hypothetical protein